MSWIKMREWMVEKQFDETMIAQADGATTPLEILDKLEDWTAFSWFAMSLVDASWKNTILKSTIEMAKSVRWLMSSDSRKIMHDLDNLTVANLSDKKFLKRLASRSEKIFITASEESSILAKAMVRELDPKKFKDLNIQFARSLSNQLMQVGAFLASTPGLPPKTFWFNISMASEMLDRILRCMDKDEVAKTMLRELVRSAIAPLTP